MCNLRGTKILGLAILVILLFSQNGIFQEKVLAAQRVQVVVNGSQVNFPDDKPYVDNNSNRTMVPVRFVSEKLGAKVDWNGAEQKVIINKDGKTIVLAIGSKTAMVGGKEVTFDAPAVIKGVRTFVPLRFISEAYGAVVVWNKDTGVVKITTGGTVPGGKPVVGQNNVIEVLGNVGVQSPGAYILSGEPITQNDPSAEAKKVKPNVKAFAETLSYSNGKVTGNGVSIPSGYQQEIHFTMTDGNGKPDYSTSKTLTLKPGQSFSFNVPEGKNALLVYGLIKGAWIPNGVSVKIPSLNASYLTKD